jgi:hypothetical protein
MSEFDRLISIFISKTRTEPLCFLPAGTKVRGDLDQASRFRQIDGSIANLVGQVNYK